MRRLTALALPVSGITVAQNGPCCETSIPDQLAKPDAASIWADDAYGFARAIGKANLDQSIRASTPTHKIQQCETHLDRTVVSRAATWHRSTAHHRLSLIARTSSRRIFTALRARVESRRRAM
jgi:hypothetical protein